MSNSQKTFYAKLEPWYWPLPFDNRIALDNFLDDFMGINDRCTSDERFTLISELRASLSLSVLEKRLVIDAFKTLSRFQFDALLEVWVEEREKFLELEEEHPKEIIRLLSMTEFDWCLIINKAHGVEAYLSKYVYPEDDGLPISGIIENIDHITTTLFSEEKYNAEVSIINTIFSRAKKINPPVRINLINAGFSALSLSGIAKSSNDIIAHPIWGEFNKLSNKKYKKEKSFLNFCSVSYPMDVYGLKDIEEDGKKLCQYYRRSNPYTPDLSSVMSIYFLLAGDFDKSLKASEISIRRYNKDFSLNNEKLMRIVNNDGYRELSSNNMLRNYTRYIVVLICINDAKNDEKKNFFIENYCLKPLTQIKEWQYTRYADNISFIITLLYFSGMNDKSFISEISKFIDGSADLSDKFLFKLAFSRPVKGGELDDLLEAMQSIDTKVSLLVFSLIVKAITISRLILEEDIAYSSRLIKETYIDVVKKKEWFLNEEAGIFDL